MWVHKVLLILVAVRLSGSEPLAHEDGLAAESASDQSTAVLENESEAVCYGDETLALVSDETPMSTEGENLPLEKLAVVCCTYYGGCEPFSPSCPVGSTRIKCPCPEPSQ